VFLKIALNIAVVVIVVVVVVIVVVVAAAVFDEIKAKLDGF